MSALNRLLLVLLITGGVCAAQTGKSAYTGQEDRQIKTLSEADIQAYLEGQGMGLAKAAELNQYPGPRHVLDLADQLQLSETQTAETQKVFDRMHADATRLGKLIVDREKELDALFSSKTIDSKKLRRATAAIARLQGELRAAHLEAHLATKLILSPHQIAKYVELRGYMAGNHSDHEKEHKH